MTDTPDAAGQTPLVRSDMNLIWLDMEMTGLEPDTDRIIEIAVVVTSSTLDRLIEGPVLAIHQSDETLAKMDQWNQNTHGRSGLIDRVRASTVSEAEATEQIRAFLGEYSPAQAGEIRTPEGATVGEHAGVFFYTLGQRGGLGIGGRADSSGEAWYVVGKDVPRNVLIAAQGNASGWLQSRRLLAHALTWIDGAAPAREFRCTAKTRYRQPDQACLVRVAGAACEVDFDEPQRAVTPGQSVVFYDGDVCLGGGVIQKSDAPFGGWHDADA